MNVAASAVTEKLFNIHPNTTQTNPKRVWVSSQYFCMYCKSLLYTLMLTYPAGGLKVGLVFIYIHTLCVRAAKLWLNFKNAQAYWIRGDKLACTDR